MFKLIDTYKNTEFNYKTKLIALFKHPLHTSNRIRNVHYSNNKRLTILLYRFAQMRSLRVRAYTHTRNTPSP